MNPMCGTFGTEDLEYAVNRPLLREDTGRGFGNYSQQIGLPSKALRLHS